MQQDPGLLKEHSLEPRETQFDWKNCWYPVSFLEDIPKDRPTGFTLHDIGLVLFFDAAENLVCLRNRCPHRAARLSDGRIVDGRLECGYHGWQFGAGGNCLHIPQLPSGKLVPARSCVRSYPVSVQSGIAWVWAGEPDHADQALIPKSPGADGKSIFSVTFQMDLPYDQGYLVENVIDVAHIHIAHDGVRGGGSRQAAKPLEFDIEDSSIAGIRSAFRSLGMVRGEDSPALSGAVVEFVAPNLIRYASKYRDAELVSGLELYSLPLGKNRCRLLYRKYSNFASAWERLRPRWQEHLIQCKILEQDMAVVIGQAEEIESDGANIRDIWLPLKTSDRLVIEYRKWLDQFGGGLPFYRGFSTFRADKANFYSIRLPVDRHMLHTRICLTCSKARARLDRLVAILWVFVLLMFGMSQVRNAGQVKISMVLLAFAGLLAVAAARRLKSQFEQGMV